MPTQAERHALLFLAGVALVGAGVQSADSARFVRLLTISGPGQASSEVGATSRNLGATALSQQIAAVDSARASRAAKSATRPPRQPAKTAPKSGESSSGVQVPTISPQIDRPRESLSINVNLATAKELEQLPRVGPALAARIIQWRDEHGPFRSVDDLRHVRGIGPATVAKLTPSVTF